MIPLPKEHPYSIQTLQQRIDIPKQATEYKQLLIRMFPDEKSGIDSLFAAIYRLHEEMSFLQDPDVPGWKKGALFPLRCRLLMKWSGLTTEQVVRQYVKSDAFFNFFTALWGYYGLPPSRLSSLYFFIPWTGYHIEGTYYIKGGAQAFSDALVSVIEEHGGKVMLRREVTEILLDNKKAYGIRIKDGTEYRGKWVVSNASPAHTLGNLIREHECGMRYRKKLLTKRIGPSLTQLYIGLSCHPEVLGIDAEDLLFLEEQDHAKDYENCMHGLYDKANFGLTNYSKMDAALNAYERGVITATLIDDIRNWPEEKEAYRWKKKEVTDIFLDRLDGYYPGLREKVVITELGTPRTMMRYTKNPEGAVYGFAQTVAQSGIKRTSSRTPISCLSLVGAWTQPGGGFQGAATSGFMEAERIHRRLQ
jgi:prolycopene isomerase